MKTGTNHFTSLVAACAYYKPYGYTYSDVLAKLRDGDIKLGMPPCASNEVATVIRGEGRYQIETI